MQKTSYNVQEKNDVGKIQMQFNLKNQESKQKDARRTNRLCMTTLDANQLRNLRKVMQDL